MYLFILASLLVPFLLAQLLPGKKAVYVTLGLFILVMGYQYYLMHRPLVDDLGDGPGSIIGLILFYFIGLSGFIGIITKLITLWMAQKQFSLTKRTIVRVGGLVLLASLVALI